jgi:hypothetical protein
VIPPHCPRLCRGWTAPQGVANPAILSGFPCHLHCFCSGAATNKVATTVGMNDFISLEEEVLRCGAAGLR